MEAGEPERSRPGGHCTRLYGGETLEWVISDVDFYTSEHFSSSHFVKETELLMRWVRNRIKLGIQIQEGRGLYVLMTSRSASAGFQSLIRKVLEGMFE